MAKKFAVGDKVAYYDDDNKLKVGKITKIKVVHSFWEIATISCMKTGQRLVLAGTTELYDEERLNQKLEELQGQGDNIIETLQEFFSGDTDEN